jgi:hypothetical protein
MSWSPIVELRQYALVPGKRDVLIDLFESFYIEGQEDTGMKIIGQFRDLDEPDRFVWLRGFPSMAERARSLADFYGGEVWRSTSDAANATMIDSDDVLLLRPARAGSTFAFDRERPPPGATDDAHRDVVEATILYLDAPADDGIASFFDDEIASRLAAAGASNVASFVTEASENNFPALPVREGENVVVWFAAYKDGDDERTELMNAARRAPGLLRSPERLRLDPTPRSLLRA